MFKDKKIYVIIPARGGSKRLPRKNIYPVCGIPMLRWSVLASQNSKYIDKCFVTTEDEEILKIAENAGANILKRPAHLSDDHVFKQAAIIDATQQILSAGYEPDIIISLQANSPQVKETDLDNAIEKFVRYDRNELFSVDNNLIQNAAFRIMKTNYVFQESLSTKCGVFIANYLDVHTVEDVKKVEAIIGHVPFQ